MIEDASLEALADRYGTPLLVYDERRLVENAAWLEQAVEHSGVNGRIALALKAVGHVGIARVFARRGFGCEVMTHWEYTLARGAGFDPASIVLNGLGWGEEGLRLMVEEGVGLVSVDNTDDLERVAAISRQVGRVQSLGVRVTPQAAGFARMGSKLGVPLDGGQAMSLVEAALRQGGVALDALTTHFAHRCTNLVQWRRAAEEVVAFAAQLVAEGVGVRTVDLGGGLDDRQHLVDANWTSEEFGEVLSEVWRRLPGCTLLLEPGRFLVGDAGTVVTSIRVDKWVTDGSGTPRRWLITDVASNLLIPIPSAGYRVGALGAASGGPVERVSVAGPICSPSSVIEEHAVLPVAATVGHRLRVDFAGSYVLSLAEQWALPLPAVVLWQPGGETVLVDVDERVQQFYAHAGWRLSSKHTNSS